MKASPVPTINRSRRSTVSTALMSILSVAVMDLRDEAGFVRIAELHLVDVNRSLPRGCALGRFENESSSMIHRHLLSVSGDRIFDWFERDPKVIAEAGSALKAIDLDVKWDELRFEQRAERRC